MTFSRTTIYFLCLGLLLNSFYKLFFILPQVHCLCKKWGWEATTSFPGQAEVEHTVAGVIGTTPCRSTAEVCGTATAARVWAPGVASSSLSPHTEPCTVWLQKGISVCSVSCACAFTMTGKCLWRADSLVSSGLAKCALNFKRKLLGPHGGECNLHRLLF